MTPIAQRLHGAIREIPDFPKPGIRFKDITPVLLDPALVRDAARALAAPFRQAGITLVAGIESRGFLLGPLLAQELGCGFVIVRKKGKLPGQTVEISYDLEYGAATIEIHKGHVGARDKVLVHDDLLATGGTALAAAQLVLQEGAAIGGFSFLVELGFLEGLRKLDSLKVPVVSLLSY
ncbi:MAG: adenine phosphoribosyltransferase [Bacteroidetes bacterium]|nr:adenine phosphoribosyltransferase [Bacteroidota bacterium]